MKNDKLLTFNEFIKPEKLGPFLVPLFNNFPANWDEEILGNVYRNMPHSLRFQKEFPEKDKELLEKTKNLNYFKKEDKKRGKDKKFHSLIVIKKLRHQLDLYEAYKIMNSYGLSNTDLFA